MHGAGGFHGLELKGPGTLLIERLDQTSERYLVDVGTEQRLHGKFYDFGKWGRHLAAGRLYQIARAVVNASEMALGFIRSRFSFSE